jgi:hypothetical protein
MCRPNLVCNWPACIHWSRGAARTAPLAWAGLLRGSHVPQPNKGMGAGAGWRHNRHPEVGCARRLAPKPAVGLIHVKILQQTGGGGGGGGAGGVSFGGGG